MATKRKPTEADRLAADLERQLAALNAQPSPVKVVENIINPPAIASKYEESRSRLSEISNPIIRAEFEKAFAGTDRQTERLETLAGAEGLTVNPATGALEPKVVTPPITPITPIPPNQGDKKDSVIINLSEQEFINTLKLRMGAAEASKPYVKKLYELVAKYYKSGSTVDSAIDLALYDAQENKLIPEFTSRFSGLFKIRDRRSAGEMIDVPTFAEYIKSQAALGDVLRSSNLSDLATETFLNTVMGTGKSVLESTNIIVDTFNLIANAPSDFKELARRKMPFATDVDLARALLTGTEGAAELERRANRYGIMAAGESQGLTLDDTQASELVARGQTYATSKPKFGQAAAIKIGGQRLTSIDAGLAPAPGKGYTQQQAISAVFDQNYQELQNIEDLNQRELARFAAKSGRFASRDRGSGQY